MVSSILLLCFCLSERERCMELGYECPYQYKKFIY